MNLGIYTDFVAYYKHHKETAILIARRIAEIQGFCLDPKTVFTVDFHNLLVIVRYLTIDCSCHTKGIHEKSISFPSEYLCSRNWEDQYNKDNNIKEKRHSKIIEIIKEFLPYRSVLDK